MPSHNFIDISGHIYGRLTVVSRAVNNSCGRVQWRCLCECGNYTIATSNGLRSGNTRSCGCLSLEISRTRALTHGHSSQGKISDEYRIWAAIKTRCTAPNTKAYRNYGGRGITMCPEWVNSFVAFYEHVGPRPSKKHSIDRKDNSKGYIPGNVRWATSAEQTRNTRQNRWLTYNGETKIITDWSADIGINVRTLSDRLDAFGWSVEKALTTPVKKKKDINYSTILAFDGRSMSMADWADHIGVARTTLWARIVGRGWSVEKALSTPINT